MKIPELIKQIDVASQRLQNIVKNTPLEYSKRLSEKYSAKIYLKREDLQEVRSYKIRGAYNLMSTLPIAKGKKGVVCASAGNHAQGVALSAFRLHLPAVIFMPEITPLQKINKVKHFGGKWVEIKLIGQTYDDCAQAAAIYCLKKGAFFVHPFDDYRVIAGQGTVGKEIYETLMQPLNYFICPIGGGGLIAGAGTYLKEKIPDINIIGAEGLGAAGMSESLKDGKVISLKRLDTFIDGAAVKTVGQKTFALSQPIIKKIITIPVGKVCATMIELYQNEGIIAEPAGALSLTALDEIAKEIKGKTVVCVLSGGNNDIMRYPEIMERSLVYQGRKHYFLIEFAQKPGQLRQFVDQALGPTDDIVRFEYIKKTAKELGPALVGIELTHSDDLNPLLQRMNKIGIKYTTLTSSDTLYSYLI